MTLFRTCLATAVAALIAIPAQALKVKNLRCEYMDSGACVQTVLPPRLSWVPDANNRAGARQTAYQILVASSPSKLKEGKADLWNSGKVISSSTAHIQYAGKQLGSFQRCFWTVRLWDENGKSSAWAKPSMWLSGVIDSTDWNNAKWIALKPHKQWKAEWDAHKQQEKPAMTNSGPIRSYADMNLLKIYDSIKPAYDAAPLLRKEFNAPPKLARADLFICGLGYFEAFINGHRVGNDVLNPAWTNFEQTSLYSHYDVTDLIRQGKGNAIGVMLGRGQYSPICNDAWKLNQSAWISQPKLLALLRLTTDKGDVVSVVTDPTWKVTEGPIVFDDTRLGEVYDARRELPGWDMPDFNDSSWKQASLEQWPMSTLQAQMLPPVRRATPYQPVRRIQRDSRITLFDIGQNIAGWARVKVSGPRGSRVLVEYCELPSDTTLVKNLHPARLAMSAKLADKHYAAFHDATLEVRQQNAYILKGEGEEEFECHFSYKGFRYARITAEPGVKVVALEGVPVHSDLRPVGSFKCSDPVANQLQHMSQITLLNNFMGIPTDCPHREKLGWTADGFLTTEAAIYNYDMAQFYTKWMRDLVGTQADDGGLNTIAPSTRYDAGVSITWPAAIAYVPTNLFEFYGDKRVLGEIYTPLAKFAEHARSHEYPGHPGLMREVLGDWVSPADSILPSLKGSSILAPPEGVITYGASSYYSVLRHLARISAIIDSTNRIPYYSQWASRVRNDFNRRYFKATESTYYGNQPTGYRLAPNVVALYEGLVPDSAITAVNNKFLVQLAANQYKAKTGFLGTRALMKWLPAQDPEAAWRVATQPEYPGWGYMVSQGATTMWEDWAACASTNHMQYSLISEYFYSHIVGIKMRHDNNGNPIIEISPSAVKPLDYASASYDSLYGKIESEWHREGNQVVYTITIPANCTANVTLPTLEKLTLPSGIHTFKL
ncbi:MAG: glycoside hydrolase family 78 protein [Muribaculum sp.]|nr:glycoside hydrolase family 78 protein [Muribaculaceae bacterium]MCM1080794.1 glycoside hydrolase family 78 protein [Muribaculum sp.]